MDEHTTICDTETWRNREQVKHIVPPNPEELVVTERKFLWLGGTTIDSMTPEINNFQYAREISKSNTKGYKIVPYFGPLK